MIDDLNILRCPACGQTPLERQGKKAICAGCSAAYGKVDGVLSFVPDAHGEKVARLYESLAADGSVSAKTVGYLSESNHKTMRQAVWDTLGTGVEDMKILDAGCGHGSVSGRLTDKNDVYGVDFSLNMLAMARDKGLITYHAGVTRLPFVSDVFDVAMSVEVIQYINDPKQYIAEMARVIKPDGRVLLTFPSASSLFRKVYRLGVRMRIIARGKRVEDMPTLYGYGAVMDYAKLAGLVVDKISLVYFPFAYRGQARRVTAAHMALASNFIILFKPAG